MVAPVFLKVLQSRPSLGNGPCSFEPDALGGFLAGKRIHSGEPRVEPAVALPQAANSALAVIKYFMIACLSHDSVAHETLEPDCKPYHGVAYGYSGTKSGAWSSEYGFNRRISLVISGWQDSSVGRAED